MRRALIVLALLAGCGQPKSTESAAIVQCRDYLTEKLKAPSTFKQVNAEQVKMPDGKWTVLVEYDAANAYGTPIRDTQVCRYPDVNGQPDTRNFIDFNDDLIADAMKAAN